MSETGGEGFLLYLQAVPMTSSLSTRTSCLLTYIVWLNCTERKVLCRDGHFAQSVEQCALANIGQTNNTHL